MKKARRMQMKHENKMEEKRFGKNHGNNEMKQGKRMKTKNKHQLTNAR